MENFELKESFASYVSLSDPESLSVADRLPRKIVWSFEGNGFELECSSGLIAKKFNTNILLIEAPYDIKANRAYILAADNRLVSNLPKKWNGLSLVYYDILSGDVDMVFLASSDCGDFRVKVDPTTGSIISIREFR
jgi:hypothetical protein